MDESPKLSNQWATCQSTKRHASSSCVNTNEIKTELQIILFYSNDMCGSLGPGIMHEDLGKITSFWVYFTNSGLQRLGGHSCLLGYCLHAVPEKYASMLFFFFSYTYSLHKHSRHLLNHAALVLEMDWKWLFIYERRFPMQCWITGMLGSAVM